MKKYTKNKTYWKYTSLSLGIHFCQSMHSKEFIILKIVKKIKKIEDKNDDDGIKCKLPPAPSLRISRIKIKRNQRWERAPHCTSTSSEHTTLHRKFHRNCETQSSMLKQKINPCILNWVALAILDVCTAKTFPQLYFCIWKLYFYWIEQQKHFPRLYFCIWKLYFCALAIYSGVSKNFRAIRELQSEMLAAWKDSWIGCKKFVCSATIIASQNVFAYYPKCICPFGKMYLSKLQNIFVQIAKHVCPNCKTDLSKWQNIVRNNFWTGF